MNIRFIILKIKDPQLLGIQIKIDEYTPVIKLILTKQQALTQAINLAKSLLNETQKIAPESKALTIYVNAIEKAEKLLNNN